MALTREQLECINDDGKRFINAVTTYNSINKFDVGTYLIQETKELDFQNKLYWKVNTFGKSHAPRKYKVVAVDKLNIPFYQKVLYNGKLCKELKYMGNLDMRHARFLVDPDMQDYILLGGDIEKYDPMTVYKTISK